MVALGYSLWHSKNSCQVGALIVVRLMNWALALVGVRNDTDNIIEISSLKI